MAQSDEERKAKKREWRAKNREKCREYDRKRRVENPEKYREKDRKQQRKRRAENPEKYRESVRKSLRKRRGIKDAHGRRKSGPCEICYKITDLVLDHGHVTGYERGWLCPGCNLGLGKFGDSPQTLASALNYRLNKGN